MKSLLLHCKNFRSSVTGLATRPKGIKHGKLNGKKQSAENCILAFVTIEKKDNEKMISKLSGEILKFCSDTGHRNVFLCPFAHLSGDLAPSEKALAFFAKLADEIQANGLKLTEGHFGSDKEVLIHLIGHPGNARFRKFK